MTDSAARARVRAGLRAWFRTPPRAHGEVDRNREVSFLELFYDLVYVVLIAQIAHHLAGHLDVGGLVDFMVVFGLVWFAWFNGTFWHELHGREDGRSRSYIFLQMILLALLAVFAGEATGEDGQAFAVTYAVLMVLYTWQWYTVQRIDDPRYRPITMRYLGGMVATVAVVLVSAFVDDGLRLVIWGAMSLIWVIGGVVLMSTNRTVGFGEGLTASLVERIGLFTIIVLGEVVVGVVEGISEVEELGGLAIATGVVALMIGFGFWWNYFDALGRRVPSESGRRLAGWMYSHLPITMSIAAGGAAMVSLVEHAADARSPANTAAILSGSVVVTLLGIALAARALPAESFPGRLSALWPTYAVACVAIVVVGIARPAPIVLAGAIALLLFLTWFRMFALFLAHGWVPRAVDGGPLDLD